MTCQHEGGDCHGAVVARGLCGKHYRQLRRTELRGVPAAPRVAEDGEGAVMQFRCSKAMKAKIEAYAKRFGCSPSTEIRLAVSFRLERLAELDAKMSGPR